MSRINIVMSTAMLAVLTLPVNAAEQTLKQQVQGAWNLVSCDVKAPTCVNPTGSVSFNGNGRYTLVIFAKDRPRLTSAPDINRETTSSDYYKSIAKGTAANFGTWSVNEADKTLTLHSEEGLFPRPAGGSDNKRTIVSVTADELKTTGPEGNYVWHRFK
jgi:hypothetical protein